jgi:hypothetical protein
MSRGCNGSELKQFVSAFHISWLPGLGSSEFAGLLDFQVDPSLQILKKTADKFAGLLIFGVGLSLQNPKKTAEKSQF